MYFENPNSIEPLLGKITFWDTSDVTDMSYLFMGAETFNERLLWNTSSVTNMGWMFWGAKAFNQRGQLRYITGQKNEWYVLWCKIIQSTNSL